MNTSTLYEHFLHPRLTKSATASLFICLALLWFLSIVGGPSQLAGPSHKEKVTLSWWHNLISYWQNILVQQSSQSRYMHLQNHFFLVPRPYQPTDTALETTTRGHHVICTGGSPFISTPSFLMVFSNFTWFQTEFHYQRFSNVSCNNCNLMLTTQKHF